ncbi:deoxyribonuclease IV [candidate division WOR-3 bacterium]|nr:deoxyribonuclease IV [candidate division WOR-3 bacterium]
MNIGFHISTAGGFKNVIPRAQERQCTTIQVFSRNPRRWEYKELDQKDIETFKKLRAHAHIDPVFIHMPYIVNLGSLSKDLYARSIDSLRVELERSDQLNAQYVIVHAGSSDDTNAGITRMMRGIDQALNAVRNKVVILIENTSGSGREFGFEFAHLGTIVRGCTHRRVGIVLDTAHAFAAGYGLDTRDGINSMVDEIEHVLGMHHVHLIHFNDSKTACGSRSDRHEHVGKGRIGNGMKYMLNHPLLRPKPFIMETPRMNINDDLKNLKTVQRYMKMHKA